MKPHNQHAPGLGRADDKLGAIARQYQRRIDNELARKGKERDADSAGSDRHGGRAA